MVHAVPVRSSLSWLVSCVCNGLGQLGDSGVALDSAFSTPMQWSSRVVTDAGASIEQLDAATQKFGSLVVF